MKTVAVGFIIVAAPYVVTGFGFTRSSISNLARNMPCNSVGYPSSVTTTQLCYNPDDRSQGRKPDSDNNDFPEGVVWKSLSDTEKWIGQTLESVSDDSTKKNPFARKEVSYVCDTTCEVSQFISRVFLRLKEMREMGDAHGKKEVRNALEQGDDYKPHTFRQTLVAVFPSVSAFESFAAFDKVVNAINKSRRNARDYVGGVSKLHADSWMTAVNMAHLHPHYGLDIEEEVDPNEDLKITSYRKQRLKARQSPYSTCVIEVRATPPMPMREESSIDERRRKSGQEKANEESQSVTTEDLQKLEALFGKSIQTGTSKDAEESFYSSIGKMDGIEELTFITPQQKGQQWILNNIHGYDPIFCVTDYNDASCVDGAHEYIFSHITMDFTSFPLADDANTKRFSYLIMPNFLKKSATSFEKFSIDVQNIVQTIPVVNDRLKVSTFHMEHVEIERRSPVPIFVLEWN